MWIFFLDEFFLYTSGNRRKLRYLLRSQNESGGVEKSTAQQWLEGGSLSRFFCKALKYHWLLPLYFHWWCCTSTCLPYITWKFSDVFVLCHVMSESLFIISCLGILFWYSDNGRFLFLQKIIGAQSACEFFFFRYFDLFVYFPRGFDI